MSTSFAVGAACASLYSAVTYNSFFSNAQDPSSSSTAPSFSSGARSRGRVVTPPQQQTHPAFGRHPGQSSSFAAGHPSARSAHASALRFQKLFQFSRRAFLAGTVTGLLHLAYTKRRDFFAKEALDRLKSDESLMNFADFAPKVPGMEPIPVEEMGQSLEEIIAEEERLLKILDERRGTGKKSKREGGFSF